MGHGQRHTWTVTAIRRKAMVPSSRFGHMSGEWGEQEVAYPRPEEPVPKKKKKEKTTGHSFVSPSSRS